MTISKDKSHNDANATASAGRELFESELEGIAGGGGIGDKAPQNPPPPDNPGKGK
jgi:hypothetical protein